MVDMAAVHLALRERAMGLEVATTGAIEMAAIATGFTRATGSFETDGFTVGSEITPSGFATNTRRVITRVQDLTLTVGGTVTAEASASGRTLVIGIPSNFGRENITFAPAGGRPYLTEEFDPGPSTLRAGPAANGVREDMGLYHLKWHGLSNTGVLGIRKAVDALAARFTPGTNLTAGTDVVRIRGDVATQVSRIVPREGGWSVCVITIPWRVLSTNIVAA